MTDKKRARHRKPGLPHIGCSSRMFDARWMGAHVDHDRPVDGPRPERTQAPYSTHAIELEAQMQ